MAEENVKSDFDEPFVFPKSLYLPAGKSFNSVHKFHQWVQSQARFIQQEVQQVPDTEIFLFLKGPYTRALEVLEEEPESEDARLVWLDKQKAVYKKLIDEIASGQSYTQECKIAELITLSALHQYERSGFLSAVFNVDPMIGEEPISILKHQQNRSLFIGGYMQAVALNVATHSQLSPQRDKIDAALSDANEMVSTLKESLLEQEEESAKFMSGRSQDIAQSNDNVTRLILERSKRFREMRDEHKAEFKRIEETFEKHVSLHDSFKYWRIRGRNNYIIAYAGLLIFVLLAGYVVDRAMTDGPALLRSLLEIVSTNEVLAQNPFSYLAFTSVPALILLWLLKFPARLFKEHLHIANDARHRQTMISTYLSLLRDKANPISPEERQLALRQIFSGPGANTADDSIPFIGNYIEDIKT